jgi:enoyl-CoA hydratase/carnithine racemase
VRATVTDVVLYAREGPVAHITLNRPEALNALSHGVVDELARMLDEARRDDEVKLVLLEGAGGNFSAGYDMKEEAAEQIESHLDWHAVLGADVATTMKLWSLPKPTVAVVRGWCLAGGCELALACDMVIAAEDARFGEPEIRYGSGPVTLIMPFVIGQKKTNELLFTGDVIDGREAERIGMVSRAVAPGDLQGAVDELVRKVVATPLAVLRLTKVALTRAYAAKGLMAAVESNLDLSAMLNAADTPEQREFDAISSRDGLKAALAWRDSRYGAIADASGAD